MRSSHHVMVLISPVDGNDWLVHDGNSGGGLIRGKHVRSLKGYVVVNSRRRGGCALIDALRRAPNLRSLVRRRAPAPARSPSHRLPAGIFLIPDFRKTCCSAIGLLARARPFLLGARAGL